ncbi:MLO-like protein [Quillaja saponaria]|uniref:MLO-like protein n=1 Tax=Quillaja saponaria TaxID=32244 RepID=A0AAD7KZ05_QUISA|nr:MLO-like protein [Quillaja saponaria]
MDGGTGSLEETPTWAVSIVCLLIFIVSFIIEAGLHHLTEFLRKRKRKYLNKALVRIKKEIMNFGFVSLLLTISEAPISKICITQAMASSFLPCKDPVEIVEPASSSATKVSASESNETLNYTITDDIDFCEAKGMVALVSRDGILQLNIFISVLAVFHIMYCIITMWLGMTKMRRWRRWEEETQTLEYQIANDPRRFQFTGQTSIGKRHLKFWSNHPPLLWLANFASGSDFNFQKFLVRAFDDDFQKIVGIRFWIWILFILFMFLTAHEFYNHYWLPFIPLGITLLVGAKLQVIITKMCVESSKENCVTRGTLLVKPNDNYFWFGRPDWLLHLLQFILVQNSFQLAFFIWTWYEYGLRSCFNRETEDIAIRIAMGIAVQFLCGYLTLPLYALVTQMGSSMKKAVFTDHVAQGLKNWHKKARHTISANRSTSSRHSTKRKLGRTLPRNKSTSSRHSTNSLQSDTSETSVYEIQNAPHPEYEHMPRLMSMIPPSTAEITEEEEQKDQKDHTCNHQTTCHSTPNVINIEEANPKIITRGTYDGEISFGSSWKHMESSRGIGEISSIVEEDDTDMLA